MHCARPLPWLAMDGRTNVILKKKKKATYRPFIRPDKPIIDSYIKAIDSIKL